MSRFAPSMPSMPSVSSFVPTVSSSSRSRQNEVLTNLVSKHLPQEDLAEFSKGEDFSRTSTERGVQRWEHQHLIAALDTLNAYQRDRRGRASSVGGTVRRSFRDDPRTRLVELLKRWLRTHAAANSVDELEVRRLTGLCRDLLNHSAVFPARNTRSFIHTIAEVYDHMQRQLREVLERDRTCAELAQRAITLSRNFLSDVIGYLLVAATELKQTDALPSIEAVALWQVLPTGARVPVKPDVKLQQAMRPAWQTHCGTLIAAVLCTPSSVRLFNGRTLDKDQQNSLLAVTSGEAGADGTLAEVELEAVPVLISRARQDFDKGQFKMSGLAGAFRNPARRSVRQSYLEAVQCVFDLTYLLGDAFVQFHRVGEGLGDYGMIRTAPWLHPFLDTMVDKVMQLKKYLETLNTEVDEHLVLATARGLKVEKPAPSRMQLSRAHETIERAVCGQDSHAQCLLGILDELRKRSAPERLPTVMEALGDACSQLQDVLSSEAFFMHVGDAYRDQFPKPGQMGAALNSTGPSHPAIAIEDHSSVAIEDIRESDPCTPVRRLGSLPVHSPPTGASMSSLSIGSTQQEFTPPMCASVASLSSMSQPGLSPPTGTLEASGAEATALAIGAAHSSSCFSGVSKMQDVLSKGVSPQVADSVRSMRGRASSARMRLKSKLSGALEVCDGEASGPPVGPESSGSSVEGEYKPITVREESVQQLRQSSNPFKLDVDLELRQASNPSKSDKNPFITDSNPFNAEPSEEGAGNPFGSGSDSEKEGADNPFKEAGASNPFADSSDVDKAGASNPFADSSDVDKESSNFQTANSEPPPRGDGEPLAKWNAPLASRPSVTDTTAASTVGSEGSIDTPQCLRAQVWRSTSACQGFKRHDQRALMLSHGRLHIFDRKSSMSIKTVADVQRDIDECQLLEGNVLSVFMRRKGRRSLLGSLEGDSEVHKIYFFEFPTEALARDFHREMSRLRNLKRTE